MSSSEFDFSQYHPMDHNLLTARCRAHYPFGYKAAWHHFTLWWTLQCRDEVKKHTICRLGWHTKSTSLYTAHHIKQEVCLSCGAPLGPVVPWDKDDYNSDFV